MKDLDLRIRTIKADSEEGIERFVDQIVTNLEKVKRLQQNLRSYLETAGLYIKGDQERLVSVVLLSCILGDIAGQMSPFERGRNGKKIESICMKRNLNYNQVVKVVPYCEEILEIIEAAMVDG